MKSKMLILGLIPLLSLVACSNPGENNSTNTNDNTATTQQKTIEEIFKEKLDQLKVGYKTFLVGKQTSYPNGKPTLAESQQIISETSAIDDKFTIKMFDLDPNGQPLQAAMETVYNIDGDACNGRLNINNEISYFRILHPSGNGVFRFMEDGYSNFYKRLKASDFVKTSDRTFTLKKGEASLNKIYKDIGTQTYGNPGFSIKTFQIFVNEDNTLETTTIFNRFIGKSYTYEYNFVGELTPIKVNEFDDRNQSYPEIKDEKFETAISSLQNQNYTLNQVDLDEKGNVIKSSTLLANKDKFYSTTLDSNGLPMNIGIYKDGENYQSVTKTEDNKFIKGKLATKEEFELYYPSFLINRSVFNFDNQNTYTLKPYIDGDTYVYSPYETDASELNKTTIEIQNDKIIITNTFGKKGTKVVSTFTNIGTTNVGYSKDSVTDLVPVSYTWKDILTNDELTDLTTFLGDINNLVCPKGLYDTKAWSVASQGKARQIKYASASMPASENDVNTYRLALTNSGWEIIEEGENPIFRKNNINLQTYSDGATLYIDLLQD